VPIIERPTTAEREEDRHEFDKLFGDLSDGNDSELDFIPKKKKMKIDEEINDDTHGDSDQESFEMDSSGGEECDSNDDLDDNNEDMATDEDDDEP
jgi:hypothetical protein